MPPSCALLGRFAISAWVALLWQHNPNPSYKLASTPRYEDIVRTRNVSECCVLALCLVSCFCSLLPTEPLGSLGLCTTLHTGYGFTSHVSFCFLLTFEFQISLQTFLLNFTFKLTSFFTFFVGHSVRVSRV